MKILFGFNGRVNRVTYVATFVLAIFGVGMLIHLVAAITGSPTLASPMTTHDASLFKNVVAGALLWMLVSLTTKRLHDVGASGWWVILALIPIALVMVFIPGTTETNKYGEVPKGIFSVG